MLHLRGPWLSEGQWCGLSAVAGFAPSCRRIRGPKSDVPVLRVEVVGSLADLADVMADWGVRRVRGGQRSASTQMNKKGVRKGRRSFAHSLKKRVGDASP